MGRRRSGRLLEGGRLLQGGEPGQPVLRLFMRWVRRPLLPAVRLWRRNIQLRVVATTLLMSLGVVLLLGFVVIGQVRNGLLDAKVKAAQSQAAGGFAVAKEKADAPARRRARTAPAADGRDRRTHAWRDATWWSSSPAVARAPSTWWRSAPTPDDARQPRAACLGQRGPGRASRRTCGSAVDRARARPRAYTRISTTATSTESAARAGHRQAAQRHRRQSVPAVLPLPAHAGGEVAQPGQGDAGDGRAVRRRAARGHRLARGAAGRHARADGGGDRRAAVRRAGCRSG